MVAGARRCPGLRPAHTADGGPDTPAYAALARVADPAGLPPAYIEAAQLDMFRDEDLAYALRPGQAGVPVELHLHPGAPHESDFIAFNTTAARAIAGRVLSSTGCPCPSPVAAVQPALIMIAAASWPHSQHRSDNLRASTVGVRQQTSRKYSAQRFALGTSDPSELDPTTSSDDVQLPKLVRSYE